MCSTSHSSKGKDKHGFVQHLVVNTPLRRSGRAHVITGSHSLTCTVHTRHSSANGMNHTCTVSVSSVLSKDHEMEMNATALHGAHIRQSSVRAVLTGSRVLLGRSEVH